ncbi:hypothetical protein Ancab_003253 [Ancistrocladus abbreviatus]
MPTFTAIALDRLLEPVASKTSPAPGSMKLERGNTTPLSSDDCSKSSISKQVSVPPHPNKLRRRNTTSFSTTMTTAAPAMGEKKTQWPQISPALYATPESTPLPDSPTSFPPSPYVINHKRRGPRLLKMSLEQNAPSKQQKDNGAGEIFGNGRLSEIKVGIENLGNFGGGDANMGRNSNLVEEEKLHSFHGGKGGEVCDGKVGDGGIGETGEQKVVVGSSLKRESEIEDFFDPQESMSLASNTDAEDSNSVEQSVKTNTPMAEFFDAWEELSSESGQRQQHSIYDLEIELQDMRMSLLMEIDKRKHAEEALNNMRKQWQMLRQTMMDVGLVLPADPTTLAEEGQLDVDTSEDICQQVYLARLVSESVGRGAAKAEIEAEMEAQLEAKNFEIARLCDRLHYYEAMNREMSQRNQEAIEMARRDRHKQRRRQRWVWGSVAAAIALGSAALAWSYIPGGNESSLNDHLQAPKPDGAAE